MSENKKTYTADDVYNKWKCLLDNPKEYSLVDKYDKHRRLEHIEVLVQWLIEYDIEFEQAKGLKNRVMLFLTTEEGRKGKGKHKNWKENTLTDFDKIVASMYMEDPKPTKKKEIAVDPLRIPADNRIVEWANKKYPGNTLMITEAHRIGSIFYFEYLEDTFD